MALQHWRFRRPLGKGFLCALALLVPVAALSACSVNPATGKSQFTALMSENDERAIGASEHPKILATFGGPFAGRALEDRVRAIGNRVATAAFAGREGVACCRFFVLDTPMVNAFATPGGYIYVSRGLLALANSESEIAAVIAHEIAHIAARHAAERYSHGAVSSLAAAVVAAAANAPGLADTAAGLGSELYVRAYSRGQENESDSLGLKYLAAAGYDPDAMASMLGNIERSAVFEQGASAPVFSYFSTHPRTADRIADVSAQSARYSRPAASGQGDRQSWLSAIDGLTWGESASGGFVRGREFLHPAGGFAFTAPAGARILNRPEEVAIMGPGGAVAIFDAVSDGTGASPADYLTGQWMRRERLDTVQTIEVAGRPAATAAFAGTVDGRPVTIRLVAVNWAPGRIFRFQIAIPQGASPALVEEIRRMTYSLREMTAQDSAAAHEYRIGLATAGAGDTAQSLAARMNVLPRALDTFAVLNAHDPRAPLTPGQRYKIVTQGR